jgi:hypothetical protein
LALVVLGAVVLEHITDQELLELQILVVVVAVAVLLHALGVMVVRV